MRGMTTEDRTAPAATAPAWLIAVSVLSVGLVAIALGADTLGIDVPVPLRRSGEALVVATVVCWALRALPLAALVDAAGRGVVVITLLVLAGTAAVQLVPNGTTWYPFSTWNMYSSTPIEMSFARVDIVDSEGDARRVRLADVLPVVTPRPFATTLLILSLAEEAELEGAGPLLEEVALLLAERAGSAPGEAVRVSVCLVDEPTPEEPVECRVVVETVVVEGDPT